MELTEEMELTVAEEMGKTEAVRLAIEADNSGHLLNVVLKYYWLIKSPVLRNLPIEVNLMGSILFLMSNAMVDCVSAEMGIGVSGWRDLHVIEYILRRWDKKFSLFPFKFKGDDIYLEEFQLQAEVLKHVIHCLDWFFGIDFSKEETSWMFMQIFKEEGLTPYRCHYTDSRLTTRKLIKSLQSQNRRLMKVADDFDNPFDKDLMPSTYRFAEICSTQSGKSDDFRKQHWYPLVKARQAWTTFYIDKGMIVALDHQNNKTTVENRGRSKNKIVKSVHKPRR